MNMFSFLNARDPSIIACSVSQLSHVRKNLNEDAAFEETVVSKPEVENLKVYLRLKRTGQNYKHLYTIKDNVLISKMLPGGYAARNVRDGDSLTKSYTFSKIFDENASQEELFHEVVKPRILNFINGQNCTFLTYGASGSGKTFTIVGTDTDPGIVPRSLEYLFRTMPDLVKEPTVKPELLGRLTVLSSAQRHEEIQLRHTILNAPTMATERNTHIRTYMNMQKRLSNESAAKLDDIKGVSVSIWVSFAEIYNEQIYDLLQFDKAKNKPRPKLKLGKNENGDIYIKDLTQVSISSGVEAYQILQYGLHYLQYAATSINSHSSRSHSIFTIKLAQLSGNKKDYTVSYFNFCDLAGSERLKKTLNKGDRLIETNNINGSLSVLQRCITCVRNSQQKKEVKVGPFRESKLTHLFQKALSGQESIHMVVNLNPIMDMYNESQHVLNFSAIAREVIVEPQLRVTKSTRFTEYLKARSTILPPNKVFTYQEKMELENQVEELIHQKAEIEESNLQACREIIDHYDKITNAREAYWEKRYADSQAAHKIEVRELCAKLQMYQDEKTSRKRRRLDDSVVVVDDLTDDENEDVDRLEKEKCELKERVGKLEKENCELKEHVSKLEPEIRDLKKTLEDACADFEEERLENIKLRSEITSLKSQVYHLEDEKNELNTYIHNLDRIKKHLDLESLESHSTLHSTNDTNLAVTKDATSRFECTYETQNVNDCMQNIPEKNEDALSFFNDSRNQNIPDLRTDKISTSILNDTYNQNIQDFKEAACKEILEETFDIADKENNSNYFKGNEDICN